MHLSFAPPIYGIENINGLSNVKWWGINPASYFDAATLLVFTFRSLVRVINILCFRPIRNLAEIGWLRHGKMM